MELYGSSCRQYNKAFLDLWNSQKILIRDMRVIQMRNKPNEFSGLIPKCLHEEPYSSIFSLQKKHQNIPRLVPHLYHPHITYQYFLRIPEVQKGFVILNYIIT
jgi:hypothetical protein